MDIKKEKNSKLDIAIQGLSPELKNEILKIDEYLMKDMRKNLKFKRTFEGEGNSRISYVSPWGFRYKLYLSSEDVAGGWHNISWIYYNTQREKQKYGEHKPDYTVEALNKLAEESPEFAGELFDRMKECVGCRGRVGCTAGKAKYEYNGKKRTLCCGFAFKMVSPDFGDVKKMIKAISDVVETINPAV